MFYIWIVVYFLQNVPTCSDQLTVPVRNCRATLSSQNRDCRMFESILIKYKDEAIEPVVVLDDQETGQDLVIEVNDNVCQDSLTLEGIKMSPLQGETTVSEH